MANKATVVKATTVFDAILDKKYISEKLPTHNDCFDTQKKFLRTTNHKRIVLTTFLRNANGISLIKYASTIIVPTFDTKVTEYLCSGWVFFSSDKFRLFK